MKTFKQLFLTTLLVLVASAFQIVNAQSTQTVAIGSTYNYVTARTVSGSGITYTITGGSSGTDYTIVSTTDPGILGSYTQRITWLAAAAGKTITISARESATCNSLAPTTMEVTVGSPLTATFTALNLTTAAECENTNDFTTTVTFNRNVVATDFPITLQVDVTVDGVLSGTHSATVTNAAGGTTGTLTIPNATFLFNGNSQTTSQTQTITILDGGVDAHGGTVNAAAANLTHSKVINPIPTTSPIVPN